MCSQKTPKKSGQRNANLFHGVERSGTEGNRFARAGRAGAASGRRGLAVGFGPFAVANGRESHRIRRIDSDAIVVNEDVPEHECFDFFAGEAVGGDRVDQFLLESGEEALHTGIVEAVADTAQTLDHTGPGKFFPERLARILTSSVGMEDGALQFLFVLLP